MIINDDLKLELVWELWGAEVDLLVKYLEGEKQQVNQEQLQIFIQGVFDGILGQLITDKDVRQIMISRLKREGKTKDYIQRWVRGWDSVGLADAKKQMEEDNG